MFEDVLQRIEADLDLPYPDRALLVEEIAGDLETAYDALRSRGMSEAEAQTAALQELSLDGAAMGELVSVHLPTVRRALERLPPPAREWLEAFALAVPLAAASIFIALEIPMYDFLYQGGPGVWLVVIVGVLGLLLELQRSYVWFVRRDHSAAALKKNTATPLYLAAAAVCLGMLATASGYYVVFDAWAKGRIDLDTLKVGLREPLPCIIVGTALAGLIVLLHGALQAGLRAIRIPEVKH